MPDYVNHLFPSLSEIPEEFLPGEPVHQKEYLINGRLQKWEGPVQEVLSPVMISEGRDAKPFLLGSYPLLTEKESLEVLDAAEKAYNNGRGEWPTMPVEERIRHMEIFVFKMTDKRQEIVRMLMWEIGKTLADAQKEFDRTVEYIGDTIEALKELDRNSSRFVIEQGIMGQIRRSPLGVVLCMGPFNYPLNETFTTLIPALIMGNVVIFKPPKLGVLMHYPLLEAFRDAFPAGVINTVYGDGQAVVGPLMKSGRINVLAFIGTSRVADILKHQHPKPHRLRCVLGLEAKNPAIFLPDANIDLAVNEAVLGTLSFNGQRCTALKILFVHRKISEEFLEKFSQKVSSLFMGMPWEKGVQITPLPEAGKPQYLMDLIKDAEVFGARIVNEGGAAIHESFFFPAVVFPVDSRMRLYHEEQFGPVIPVAVFDDIEEPIAYMMQSNYGQQVSLFGNDPQQIARLIDPLVNQVCRVNLNSQCQRGPDTFPFTGRKDSAEGTLSVSDALRVFTIRTLVAAKTTTENKMLIKEILRGNQSAFLNTDFIF
ncbi:MAG: NADP-dependent glyceraldehyde-3-phosphate dehydrogenase [Bacteroidales bacterium]|nr:NADP-dependent glyceraldehyde-3-phosphate dehydrogenase [Lentimicrobiaceae bacterium]MDD5695934.1 NADP-dependent glyceraldehyde-3-phosphate dehydrogenase [Bacteroidales bacterium]